MLAGGSLIKREALTAVQKAIVRSGRYPARILQLAREDVRAAPGSSGFISQAAYADLLDTLAEEAHDPYFGARVGLATDWRDMSLLGWATLNSPTIGSGLRSSMRYQHTWRQATTIHVKEEGRTVRWTIKYGDSHVCSVRQEPERALGSAVSVLRGLIGPGWAPLEVLFQHQRLADETEYRRLFGAPVHFSQPETGLVFDREVLDYPTPNADPRLLGVLESYVQDLAQDACMEDELSASVRRAIKEMLEWGAPSMRVVATRLGMSSRTLQRRLHDRDVQFATLLDDTRYYLALEYLRVGEFTITEVALRLGYANLPAFDRAFKRWTGKTPVAFRQDVAASAR